MIWYASKYHMRISNKTITWTWKQSTSILQQTAQWTLQWKDLTSVLVKKWKLHFWYYKLQINQHYNDKAYKLKDGMAWLGIANWNRTQLSNNNIDSAGLLCTNFFKLTFNVCKLLHYKMAWSKKGWHWARSRGDASPQPHLCLLIIKRRHKTQFIVESC